MLDSDAAICNNIHRFTGRRLIGQGMAEKEHIRVMLCVRRDV